MLAAIQEAQSHIELEMYIFADDETGRKFLQALTEAAKRGIRVRVLVDSFGSFMLPANFFAPLTAAGGGVKFFNPLRFHRFGVRDHRKLLLCDWKTIFIGGANISDAYAGDGVTEGWFDTMTQLEDAGLAMLLVTEFERLFTNAEFESTKRRRLRAFRPLRRKGGETQLFPEKPGRNAGSFQRALQEALATATTADLITPYFLPRRRLRKALREVVKRGGRVRLLLAGKSDVLLSRLAAQVYYARLIRAGVEIYEYQPQILHAKLYRVEGKVFAGSTNLDVRSLKLNYELMLCFSDAASVKSAQEIFENALKHSVRIELKPFRKSQGFWQRLKNRWAHFLLKRIDPLVALRHIR